MEPNALKPVIDFAVSVASQVGVGAVIFILGLTKEWWVMGSQYKQLKATCESFERLAEINGKVADTGLEMAKR